MLHRMHDSVRAQRLGSWTWAVVMMVAQVVDIGGLVVGDSMSRSASCEAAQVMAMVQAIAICVVNGTHGMRFALKGGLVAFQGLRGLIETAICPLVAVALAPVALIASAILIQMAELYLRRSYAKQYCLLEDKRRLEERLKEKLRERLEERLEKRLDDLRVKPLLEDKRRLEERNEQLQAEKERLLYDVHRRGRPLDDDDDRSAIGRGFLAGSSQLFNYGGTDPSEPGGAPSDTPPTLPPGPPSSASSASGQKQLAAEALADMAMDAGAAQQSIRMVLGANQPGVKAEWLTEMCNELDEGHNDGGAGSEPQEPHLVPVGPPGSLNPDQGSMTPRQRALHVARQRLRFARTMIESYQVVQTLALALGARRVEGGTIKALHAVLLRMDRPGMSEQEACTSTGASLSSFQKWGRMVQHARLDLPPSL